MAITTGKVRASYVHIFQPRIPKNKNESEGDPRYSVTLLIPKTDNQTLNAIFAEIEKTKLESAQKVFNGNVPPMCKIPIYDGDGIRPSTGEPFGDECKGHMVMTASAKQKPLIIGLDMNDIINPAEVYSGCYIRANINFFAYNNQSKGIGCGLNAVQKIEDGEPLTARVSAEEAFGGANTYTAVQTTYQQPVQMSAQGYPGAGYGSGMAIPQTTYQQPVQQPAYQQPAQQIDPITGRPMLAGGVMGLS